MIPSRLVTMPSLTTCLGLGFVTLVIGVAPTIVAQESAQTTRVTTAPTVARSTSTDWPLHNLDLQNTRFARVDQITSSNVGSLVLK